MGETLHPPRVWWPAGANAPPPLRQWPAVSGIFDVEAQTESESDGSATEDSGTNSSSGDSDGADDPRGPTKGAYVDVEDESDVHLDESDAKQDESNAELAKTVAERVKGTKRKRKPPSSLRSPMMIFKNVKKSRPTEESPKMKSGSVPTMKSKREKKKSKPNNLGSQPRSPKLKRGSACASFDDKRTDMKSKKNKSKTTGTRMSDLGSMYKRNVGMDQNQQEMDALTPRQAAAVQYVSNLIADNKGSESCVISTRKTSTQHVTAIDMRGHIIPRINDEPDNVKYVCTGVVDSYAGYLSQDIQDNRCFRPSWNAYILSNKDQVERVLQPENRENYREWANTFYDHELVFFPFRLFHRGHHHWILVVMNHTTRELQVLDSLWNPNIYIEQIENMRTGIERMTSFARRRSPGLPTDVGTYQIRTITNLPKQTDGTSCGLFVIKYMQLWDGTRLVRDFTQVAYRTLALYLTFI